MTSRATTSANPFASVLDPSGVLAAAQESSSLNALPAQVHLRMDMPSTKARQDAVDYDAAIEAGQPVPSFRSKREVSGGTVIEALRETLHDDIVVKGKPKRW